MQELYLIDGSSYIYRAYYAIKGLSTSKGLPTNAVYGFTNMLIKIIQEKKPQFLAIAFDPKGPTKRQEVFAPYKAQRPAMPDSLSVQIPYIHRVVEAFNIPILLKEGYEADDVIGTAARRAEEDGYDVVIVTGDKDMLQLVTPRIRTYDSMKDKFYGEEDVRERFGVPPQQVPEVMALMGDSIDNIPGIKGIGEKTAKDLIASFGSVNNLLGHLEEIGKPKLRSMLREQADSARLSLELAVIDTGLPLDMDYERLKFSEPDPDKLKEVFRELEFFALLKILIPAEEEKTGGDYHLISELNDLDKALERISDSEGFAFYVEGDSEDDVSSGISGMGFSLMDKEAWCLEASEKLPLSGLMEKIRPLMENPDVRKYSHDIKRQIILMRRAGIKPGGITFDTMIASYLLNPGRPDHRMEGLAFEYLGEVQAPGTRPPASICRNAEFISRLVQAMGERLRDTGVEDLFHHVEIPLAEVLAEMEMTGIRVDPDILRMLSREMDRDMDALCRRIYSIAGEEFNINSPKQLSVILFDKLGLKPIKKTKTGYSTNEAVLTELALQHELPAEILSFRQLAKLKSTYVDALLGIISPETGRIHTSFSQTVTATGRLSSSRPNLQNIPIRTEAGQRIRDAFVAEAGFLFLSADYSQIELRILAHLCGDPLLTESFRQDEDIHARTASEIFMVSPEDVTPEMRRRAKAVNFGIVYGMGPFGLASDLGISQQEAREYIDSYFARHTGVKEFIESTLLRAREDGYVTTILKRRRYLPELSSSDNSIRQFGERIAVNTPVQGSAADIIKLAMINIHKRIHSEGLGARMLLQVHDELLFEVPENELERTKDLVIDEMEGVMSLSVPLKVDTGFGKNWREAG